MFLEISNADGNNGLGRRLGEFFSFLQNHYTILLVRFGTIDAKIFPTKDLLDLELFYPHHSIICHEKAT